MMMDREFGSNTSCVILSLMGLDDRPIKQLVQGHKRVLSDEYHHRVASTAWHVRRSSFKCYSSGMSKNCETSEASAAISRNKCSKRSTEDNVLGEKAFVDELYSSRNKTRQYIAFDNSSEPSTSITGRYSCKRLLGNSYTGSRDGNYTAYLLSNCNGCRDNEVDLFSQKSPVKIDWGVSGKNNTAYEPTNVLKVAVREVDVKVEDGERLPRNSDMLCQPTSCSMSERSRCPAAADHAIEQETSPKDLEDSFYTNGSSIEMDSFKSFDDNHLHSPDLVLEPFDEEKLSKLSEHGTHLHSFRFTPSTARPGETRTTVSSDEDHKDHCGTGCCEQECSKPWRISKNREFNYLVDILTEAGFCRKDLASSLGKWHSVESPLTPFIFEKVEKRYADDKSWETSDRQLLFDRINSSLRGILLPSMLLSSRHISARISNRFRQLDEDVLWSSLVEEGRELKGKTIKDLLGSDLRSLDLGELLESIVMEIEWAVINELAAELVSE